jgi:hypothetical protein
MGYRVDDEGLIYIDVDNSSAKVGDIDYIIDVIQGAEYGWPSKVEAVASHWVAYRRLSPYLEKLTDA